MPNKKNHDTASQLTTEQELILKLQKRVYDLEVQMSACLRYIRYRAEQEAKERDPSFRVHDYAKS